MLVRQEREAVKDWTGFAREAEVDACAEEAVQGIDDEKASLGSLEGVFDDRGIAEIERGADCPEAAGTTPRNSNRRDGSPSSLAKRGRIISEAAVSVEA